MAKIVFWGAGERLKEFFAYFDNHRDYIRDEFLYIVDSDKAKHKAVINGLEVYGPKKLKDSDFDLLIITPIHYKDLIRSFSKMEINVVHMLLDDYWAHIIADNQCSFFKRQEVRKDIDCSCIEIVIYTAISKGYDELKKPKIIMPNAKYVCFTDDESIKSDVWEIRHVDFGQDRQRGIRKYKILPHMFFAEELLSVWVDGNITIESDVTEYINKYFNNDGILLFCHPERVNLFEEAEICIDYHKDNKSLIKDQIKTYEYEALVNAGLFCGGVIVRNHHKKKVVDAMELWWEQVSKYSFRDQISLPYVLYKTGLKPDLSLEYI